MRHFCHLPVATRAALFEVPESFRRVPLDGSALLQGLLGM